jgi:3-methyladenine DNA glycosylase AlkC
MANAPESTGKINPERRRLLDSGGAETRNLAECLAVDFVQILSTLDGGIAAAYRDQLPAGAKITAKMRLAGSLLQIAYSAKQLDALISHPADTIRGMACFAIGGGTDQSLTKTLGRLQPFAADTHFGVREWAWMACREPIIDQLATAIDTLASWTAHPDANVRRFASEATRPRGVWCAHIPALKADPSPGLAILKPLRRDPSRYVQDSVANWINDASKTSPEWACVVCREWQSESSNASTAYICRRAQRTLK